MTLLVAELELRVAAARRRLFVLNVLIPLVLVTPIALGAAPPYHAAAVYAVLFALFGTFGSAIPLVRDAEAGLLARVLQGGVRPAGYLLERAGANALLDGVQLLPALGVVGWSGTAGAAELGVAALVLALTLWVANLLGAILGAIARSQAETALFAATGGLLLLHVSGVFRTPAPGSLGARLEAGSPFRALHESLLAVTAGTAGTGVVALVAWALVLPGAVALLAGPLTRALERSRRG